jgi:diguanylate cyclase (GGDEF)-like protein
MSDGGSRYCGPEGPRVNREGFWAKAEEVGCAALMLALGVTDLLTGRDLSFYPVYLIVISTVATRQGVLPGLFFTGLAFSFWITDLVINGSPMNEIATSFNLMGNLVLALVDVWFAGWMHDLLRLERVGARTDELTGLINRRGFLELAGYEIERHRRAVRPMSFVYIDCDDFKVVNDTRGHAAGDRLLRLIGVVMESGLRQTDTVARMGGDEFVALLPDTDGEAATVVVGKVLEQLAASARRHGFSNSFSAGVITFANAPPSLDYALSRADELMYRVKAGGKNGLVALTEE